MKDNGGPAFPCPGMTLPNDQFVWPEAGMTLRDYFAAKAMAAYILLNSEGGGRPGYCSAAGQAYAYADAMLEARRRYNQV